MVGQTWKFLTSDHIGKPDPDLLPVSCEAGYKIVILHGLVARISEIEIKSRVVAPMNSQWL